MRRLDRIPSGLSGWVVRKTSARVVSRLTLLAGVLILAGSAQAQFCPAPWSNAGAVYGLVSLKGSGTSMSTPYTETTNQNVMINMKMPGSGVACSWSAIPGNGIGSMVDTGSINDQIVISGECPGGALETDSFVAAGTGTIPSASFGISFFTNQYVFAANDAFNGVSAQSGCADSSLPGPVSWGSVQTWPFFALPASVPVLFGTYSYASPSLDITGSLTANWDLAWVFTAVPDKDCDRCKHGDAPATGSEISPTSQILGENVSLVGTPFFLHYDSSRVPGHAGADLFAMLDALSLGGWTLNVHHAFEPMLLGYCAGGSCTPYALVPKAVFFGDGNTRSDADVQASVSLNGNYLVTSEDGTEVYVFNAKGQHLQTLASLTGAVVYTFAYDANNRLISVTYANTNVTSIQRDSSGNPISITSAYGQKTTLAVDTNGLLSQITDPAGHATKLTNSSTGLLASLTDPNGRVYSYQYDSMGMLTKHSDPAGGSVTLAKTDNASGYSVLNTTGGGRTSTYAVAFASTATQTSQTSTTTWPNGLIATGSQTQQNGQVTDSATLPNGSSYTKTLGPDPRWGMQVPVVTSASVTRGNLTESITQSRTATLGTVGDPFSLTSQTDTTNINGRTYTSVYTAATKSIVDKTPVGRMTTTLLDAQERVSSVQTGSLAATSLTYDIRGNITAIAQGTRNTTVGYDSNGNVASTTDPLGLTRAYTYDAAGNLLTTTLEDGRVVKYAYDADGNLRSVTPPGETAHAYSYSPVNLPTIYTPPVVTGGGTTTYSYNLDGDVTKVTRPDGEIVSYKYDSAGRVSGVVTPTATITYGYSSTTGHLTKAAVSGGETIGYSYNGSLPTRAVWTGTVSGTVTRAYNNNFWKSSEGVTGGSNIALGYDKDGLLTKAGALTLSRMASTGLYTGGTLGSSKDTIAYNTFAERTAYAAQFGTTTLYNVSYTRDKVGRVNAITETIGGTTTSYAYAFDKAGRLTSVKKNGTTASSYGYDHDSNRLTATTSSGIVSGTYDAQDRLLTYGTAAYTYTANGEVATKTVSTQNTTYQYDALENLSSVTLPSGTAISYIVDAENRRVGKKVNGVVTVGFLYDGDQLVAQLDANNQVVSQFTYGAKGGAPEYMVDGGVTYRIFADHLGSPRLVVNSATGAIAQRMDYDEFGNVINDTNPGFQPFGFAGGLYDPDTKLVRFGARDYDASAGRWTAKDPIRFDGGDTNLYGYVVNDPINLIDPTGLADTGTCPCKDLEKMTQDAAERTVKNPDPATSTKGPKLSQNPGLDRLGVTKAPDAPTSSPSNPVSVETHGLTVTPTSVEGGFTSQGGTHGTVNLGYTVTPDLSRNMTFKDGTNHMTLPFPLKKEFQVTCEIHF